MKSVASICCVSVITSLLLTDSGLAQTSFPMITYAYPVAVQRGQTLEVVVNGQMNFAGAYQALFEGSGLSAEVISSGSPPVPGTVLKDAKLKIIVAKDASLGVREFRIATSLGLSSVGQLLVVDHPVVMETAANNTVAQAQPVKLPCTLVGKLEALEDIDFFKFEAKEGEVVSFEMFCARLQDKIHDLQKHAKPMLTLFDGEGRELAANDHFFFADPLLTCKIPKTGTYFLQVRESTFDGDPRWVYGILATNKAYISHVFPMAGNPGKTIEVEPVGSAKLLKEKVALTVPALRGLQQVQLDVDGVKTNPATFLVSDLPQYLEQEPNDDPAQANRVTVPVGINGRIGKKRDIDHFIFAAKKGKALRLELKARRFGTLLNSSLHGILEIMTPKGALVASNDTSHGLEASLVFTPAADGDYILRVRDLNSKGAESSVYHVELDWAVPDFTLRCDPDKAMIGPGSSTSWYVHVNRENGFIGPVRIDIKGLPKEVTASQLTIPATMTQGIIVLSAAPNANLTAARVSVVGTASVKRGEGKEETLVRSVTPNQEIYLPGGGRGRFDVNLQAVAVTSPSDILKVDVNKTQIVLKPGEEVKIDVSIERRQDYDKPVFLDVLLQHLNAVMANPLPPGVTIVPGKSKTLLGTGSKGHIVLKVAPNAEPIENVPISILANVSINFVVKIHYSSPPISLSIRK